MFNNRRLLRQLFWCGSLCSIVALSSQLFAGKGGGGKPGGEDPPPPYAVIDLGGFEGGTHVQSSVNRLSNPNELGIITVVGDSRAASGDFQAAVWTAHPELGPVTLDNLTPYSFQGEAKDTNDAGCVVGWSTEIGFLAIPGQPLIELPALSSAEGRVSVPTAINNLNQIVGNGLVDVEIVVDGEIVIETVTHGLLWQVDETGSVGTPIDLGLFFPNDINEFGVMVGQTEDPSFKAAIGTMDEMGQLNVSEITTLWSRLWAVNDLGDAVGWLQPSPGEGWQAFLWDVDNGIQLLGVLPQKDESIAYGINNHREIVGNSIGKSTGRLPLGSAFLWRDGEMIDLNDYREGGSDYHAGIAYDINDAGQIAVGLKVYLSKTDAESHVGLLVPNLSQP